jgi:hypothetical protein
MSPWEAATQIFHPPGPARGGGSIGFIAGKEGIALQEKALIGKIFKFCKFPGKPHLGALSRKPIGMPELSDDFIS